MKRREFIKSSVSGSLGASLASHSLGASALEGGLQPRPASTRKILIAGGNFNTTYIKYMAQLTGKARPRLCYLPTASADSDKAAVGWFQNCAPLNVEAHVQNMYIESLTQKLGWDEVLLSMDGIVASGGNTLNQQAIWKAQGIDVILRQAWDKGIVLGLSLIHI